MPAATVVTIKLYIDRLCIFYKHITDATL